MNVVAYVWTKLRELGDAADRLAKGFNSMAADVETRHEPQQFSAGEAKPAPDLTSIGYDVPAPPTPALEDKRQPAKNGSPKRFTHAGKSGGSRK